MRGSSAKSLLGSNADGATDGVDRVNLNEDMGSRAEGDEINDTRAPSGSLTGLDVLIQLHQARMTHPSEEGASPAAKAVSLGSDILDEEGARHRHTDPTTGDEDDGVQFELELDG